MISSDIEMEIDSYVKRLLGSMRSIPDEDRLRICSNIHRRLSEDAIRGAEGALAKSMSEFGTPQQFARKITDEFFQKSSCGSESNRLGKLTAREIIEYIFGFLANSVAIILYTFSATFATIAVMKPFAPQSIGAWYGANGWTGVGFSPEGSSHGAVDVIGFWAIPLGLGLAAICYVGGMRWLHVVRSISFPQPTGSARVQNGG